MQPPENRMLKQYQVSEASKEGPLIWIGESIENEERFEVCEFKSDQGDLKRDV